MHVFKCAACLLLDLPFYWFGMRNPSGTVPAFTFLSARVLPHPLVLPRPCQWYTRSHWWPSRRFSSIEPFVSTVCGIDRWQVRYCQEVRTSQVFRWPRPSPLHTRASRRGCQARCFAGVVFTKKRVVPLTIHTLATCAGAVNPGVVCLLAARRPGDN